MEAYLLPEMWRLIFAAVLGDEPVYDVVQIMRLRLISRQAVHYLPPATPRSILALPAHFCALKQRLDAPFMNAAAPVPWSLFDDVPFYTVLDQTFALDRVSRAAVASANWAVVDWLYDQNVATTIPLRMQHAMVHALAALPCAERKAILTRERRSKWLAFLPADW